MKTPFFITGLPRSRTAWLANFLTYGESYCHHDALRFGTNTDFLRRYFDETASYDPSIERVGDSDSGLLAIAPQVARDFPDSRWVLIERDAEQCVASAHRVFGKIPYPGTPLLTEEGFRSMMKTCSAWCQRVKDVVPEHNLMVIPFLGLEGEHTAHAVWDWCNPHTPFNFARYDMLNDLSVNIIPEKLKTMSNAVERWKGVMA